ncbi:MAG: hypothetical protein M5U31_06300 [Acidimicrobiia bacterium]|nr:hypothetical protein [Acidimicrobiia bacterium]
MSASELSAAVLWPISADLVVALDERLGFPVDSYLNGSQTWLAPADESVDEPVLEWRLHPVAGFRIPKGCPHSDLWEAVVGALSADADPGALTLGEERRALTSLWEGLECFAPFGDAPEPATLATATSRRLGIPPEGAGLVDHAAVGDAWERARGDVSIMALLREELGTGAGRGPETPLP